MADEAYAPEFMKKIGKKISGQTDEAKPAPAPAPSKATYSGPSAELVKEISPEEAEKEDIRRPIRSIERANRAQEVKAAIRATKRNDGRNPSKR
jgi:hypothetical protein